ncbi:hypothetical protein EG329_004592 [Mollisiaceae sp. DMI_Dod_QoI]|nr:hypothetical protein EG329_004592 [Helotiales sp. DMI_Dod_QoI]
MADEERYELDNNESQGFFKVEKDVELESKSGDLALQRLIRTAAGQNLCVSSAARSALDLGNWGGLLGAAPDALGWLGKSLVLASDPLAATLIIPETANLPYRSLKANLVECFSKGCTAFRDAERKMKKVSNLASAIREPGGIIDQILEDVQDDDLAELDLPEQLATLRRMSTSCIKDTTDLKTKVDDWGKFAKYIHRACVDGDQDLSSKEKGLGDQIEVMELCIKLKRAAIDVSKSQTEEYRRQLAARQKSYDKAEKSNYGGAIIDFALNVGDAALHMAKSYFNPLSATDPGFGSQQADTDSHSEIDSHMSHGEEDPGVNFAETLLPIFRRVARLLTYGPDENGGVDWKSLTGHADPSNDINSILSCLREVYSRIDSQQSGAIRQIRAASGSGEEAILEIQGVVNNKQNLGNDIHVTLTRHAPTWLKQVTTAQSDIADRLSTVLEATREAQTKWKEGQNHGRNTKMTRAEIRFERFKMAQQALFDAEGRLNKRLEEDLKMTEEINDMRLNLQRSSTSKDSMDLQLRALELKGYYLVAQKMADTYTEVSVDYIIPGINLIQRLSLPEANNLTKEQRTAKMSEIGRVAENAKDEVKRIANKRKNEMIRAMIEDRGEIREEWVIGSG